ncbi:Zinc finger protein ZAT5 [Zea mays]|jgi:hypothetical protein|uniref:Zinc finger protein ZAT11 n=2 Tax=Zea mays TaxID=4577 RepID=K7VF20_MAIZE|nr:zinc finger protein ZAT8 [Zea mays]AQL07606.1 Zinc finger protein ZAT11 [Zea mays]PWZ05899.1 Zinc finger protein ZAT5 [Zea mays]|eukprot:XP_008660288.1 zinc finger protein ZAT8 [Zea mays]
MAYGKRSRQKAEEMVWLPDGADVARFLLLFSGHQHYHGASGAASTDAAASAPERVFECKTCSRQFPSFQALGGHRASHKKPRLADGGVDAAAAAEPPKTKPKVHGCSICGLEFAIGQALGGHMRRHRAAEAEDAVGGSPGLGLDLSLGPKRDRVSKATVPSVDLVLDLNAVPEELDEEQDCAKLGLSIDFPVAVVDFLR